MRTPSPPPPEPEWRVAYWCEAAQHWLAVTFRADEVIDAVFEG